MALGFEVWINRMVHAMSARFRARRNEKFRRLFSEPDCPHIVDFGGLRKQWDSLCYRSQITILNLSFPGTETKEAAANYHFVIGNGCRPIFKENAFDLAFSNSAIEHVGGWAEQQQFAEQLRLAGKAVYCQTPYRWFPVELHYWVLFLHWIPGLLENYFVSRYLTLWGWFVRPDRARAAEYKKHVRLLTVTEMRTLFPDCEIVKERAGPLVKSLIAVRKMNSKQQR